MPILTNNQPNILKSIYFTLFKKYCGAATISPLRGFDRET